MPALISGILVLVPMTDSLLRLWNRGNYIGSMEICHDICQFPECQIAETVRRSTQVVYATPEVTVEYVA